MAKKVAVSFLGVVGVVAFLGTLAFLGIHVLFIMRERAIPFSLSVVGGAPQEPQKWVEDEARFVPVPSVTPVGECHLADSIERPSIVEILGVIDADHLLVRVEVGSQRRAGLLRREINGNKLFLLDDGLLGGERQFVKGVKCFIPLTDARLVKVRGPGEGRGCEIFGIFDLWGEKHAVRFALKLKD